MSLHFYRPLTLILLSSAQDCLYFLLDEALLSMHDELIVLKSVRIYSDLCSCNAWWGWKVSGPRKLLWRTCKLGWLELSSHQHRLAAASAPGCQEALVSVPGAELMAMMIEDCAGSAGEACEGGVKLWPGLPSSGARLESREPGSPVAEVVWPQSGFFLPLRLGSSCSSLKRGNLN